MTIIQRKVQTGNYETYIHEGGTSIPGNNYLFPW